MQDSKIPKLSNEELIALTDVKFYELKQSATEKIMRLLSILETKLKAEASKHNLYIPDSVLQVDGKISKGENYRGLPYLVLDYPRYFKKENIFAFRSMFWWGNYFTFTLHLSGMYFQHFLPKIKEDILKINLRNTYVSIGDNQWVHHIDDANYLSLSKWGKEVNSEQYFKKAKYIKLVRKLDLNNWEKVPEFGVETFNLFLNTLN